jgi:hypothetical protein
MECLAKDLVVCVAGGGLVTVRRKASQIVGSEMQVAMKEMAMGPWKSLYKHPEAQRYNRHPVAVYLS